MQHTKKWLAAMLAAAIVLSDCGGMTVLATEDTNARETSVSENTVEISDEFTSEGETGESDDTDVISLDPSSDTENIEADSASDTATELPALHIGQIKKGEELPDADDTEFEYDLPISFALSDQIVLFVNYNLNTTLTKENGTLVWSILRGEKGMTPGSTGLIEEDDDWTDFETVSSSLYFTLTENEDKKSDYYQTVELALKDTTEQEAYDYYIRAAYYPEARIDEPESFYAAVTVPFLSQNTDTEEMQEDTAAIEDTQSDSISDNTTTVEDTVQEELQNKELVDATQDDVDAVDSDSLEEDGSQESVSENSETVQNTEPFSALYENDTEDDVVPPTKNSVGVLTVSSESVTLHPTETISVSATVVPKSITDPITWESADTAVATVDENGKITAIAKGITQIIAKCGNADDISATVKVNVIEADKNEVYDLSGDIWVSGFQKENEALVYTGQKITQSFQVYHKETLLKEKTDYTLTYKNNVNAADWDAVKAPSVTITMKGQYQGSRTLYFTIYPADIKSLDIYNPSKDNADENDDEETASSGYKQTVNYSKNLKIPNPELTFGKKKLTVNKDFSCDYTTLQEELGGKDYKKGASYSPDRIYHYTVNGKGNFTGSIPMQLVVLKDKKMNFSSAAVTLSQKQYEYHGTALSKSDVTITKLKISGKELEPNLYDYEVYADGIDNAYIMVYPTFDGEYEGYRGFKKVALKMVGGRDIKNATLGTAWKGSIPFSQTEVNAVGGLFQETTGVLTYGDGEEEEKTPLVEGEDYTVKYTNAKKVGTVTATFTGKGRYKGTRKEKYKIEPNIDKNNFTIRWKNVTRENDALVIAYQKGGAVPDFVLVDQDNNVLKNKTDYTVKLTNNKKPGDMTCEITGKGNYKGYKEAVQIQVKNGDISQCTLSVPDKPYSAKANAWKSKVTVKDVNGKTLAAGKDYEKEVTYSYAGMVNEQPPEAGTTVTVTVTGKGLYEGDATLSNRYRIFQNNISKLQIVIDSQEYTGKEITLPSSAIHVYANAADKKAGKPIEDATSCYEIIEYKNNIKAGTAKVTLHGLGDYGGTKTYSFKILKKVYLTNRIKSIKLDKTSLAISLAEKEKRTLTATLTPIDASKEITNPTVIWSTSNSNIATVNKVAPDAGDTADTEADTKNNTVTAAITVKKAGTVTITATTQDGNKKATCRITISMPTLKEKGQTIKGKTGDAYQLSFVQDGDYEVTTDGFTFESDNETVASVDNTGLITMNRFGTATIKVYVGNNQSVQQCYVIVERASDDELNDSRVLKYDQKPGCDDDTQAINDLLQRAEDSKDKDTGIYKYDTVYIPAGIYHINAVKRFSGGIILRDNQNLILSPDATLVALPNNQDDSRVIYAFGRSNITISGGKIVGEREGHIGSSGEGGHGIDISGCTNVYISDVEVSNCWGDGIYLGFYDGPNVSSNRVTIENCNLHHNRRSNLSITDVSNVTVNNCRFNYAKGTNPQYGIDIEPNPGRTCSNVAISNSTFQGNAKGTILILGQLNAHVKSVTITNCKGDKKPLVGSGYGGGGTVSGVKEEGNNWNWNG